MRRCQVNQMLPTGHLRDTVEVVHRLVATPSIVVRRRRRLHRPAETRSAFRCILVSFAKGSCPRWSVEPLRDPVRTPGGHATTSGSSHEAAGHDPGPRRHAHSLQLGRDDPCVHTYFSSTSSDLRLLSLGWLVSLFFVVSLVEMESCGRCRES